MRELFSEKYSSLANFWNMDNDLLYYIIRRYEKLYDIEIEKLKDEGMQLPNYFKDKRTDEEYIYDLIDGWVMEDIICDAWLRPRLLKIDSSIIIKVMGTNRDRVIQKNNPKAISTEPDLIFSRNGVETRIELQMARKAIPGGYDMKQTKVERAIRENNYFLWVIIPANKYFIINAQKEMSNLTPIPNPFWGGKIAYHIDQNFISSIGDYSSMSDELSDVYCKKLGLLSV